LIVRQSISKSSSPPFTKAKAKDVQEHMGKKLTFQLDGGRKELRSKMRVGVLNRPRGQRAANTAGCV